jgi:hypothetical protein
VLDNFIRWAPHCLLAIIPVEFFATLFTSFAESLLMYNEGVLWLFSQRNHIDAYQSRFAVNYFDDKSLAFHVNTSP